MSLSTTLVCITSLAATLDSKLLHFLHPNECRALASTLTQLLRSKRPALLSRPSNRAASAFGALEISDLEPCCDRARRYARPFSGGHRQETMVSARAFGYHCPARALCERAQYVRDWIFSSHSIIIVLQVYLVRTETFGNLGIPWFFSKGETEDPKQPCMATAFASSSLCSW